MKQNTNYFYDSWKHAFRAGLNVGESWYDYNVGKYSIALGVGSVASGWASTSIGYDTVASGDWSTALGQSIEVQGSRSFGFSAFTDMCLGCAVVTDPNVFVIAGAKVGIGVLSPQRSIHINGVMRLEPRKDPPASPKEGDLYVNSSDHHIYCFLNNEWKILD